MKIYISGKITGYELSDAKQKFKESETYLLSHGFTPINPFDLSEFHPDKTWKDYMIEDIKGLFDCDGIFMQADWQGSKGARVEHAIAKELGLVIFYESSFIDQKKLNQTTTE